MGNKKILIVDDDPERCMVFDVRLKANHYETHFATDAGFHLAAGSQARPAQAE